MRHSASGSSLHSLSGIEMAKILRTLLISLLFLIPFAASAQTLNFTTPGQFSFVVPAGVFQINVAAYGNGDFGSRAFSMQGGSGGGFCQIQKTVTPGQTVFLQVSNSNPGGPDNLGSWINISSNVQPTSSAQGCIAQGGNSNVADCPSGPCIGVFGDVNTSGAIGNSGVVGGSGNGGPGGNGAGGTGTPGGAGGPAASLGMPPHLFPAGGNGGIATSAGTGAGVQPGGGGGGSTTGTAGGANGEVIVVFVFTPPVSSGASQMFLTWPG